MQLKTLSFISAAAFTLAACAPNGSSLDGLNVSSLKNKAASTLSVYITDDISALYAEVWVNVLQIKAKAIDGSEVVLFADTKGQVFNLASLAGVGQLLAIQTIAPGTYSQIEVVLAKDVNLVDKTGVLVTKQFATNGATIEIPVAGQIVVNADLSTSVAFDFNLQQFSINDAGFIVPVVLLVNDTTSIPKTIINSAGVVSAVDGDRVVVVPANSNSPLSVKLDRDAVVVNGNSVNTNSGVAIPVGARVQVRGDVDSASGQVNANRIDISNDNDDATTTANAQNAQVEFSGIVVSQDANSVTIDVTSGSVVPQTNTMTVLLSGNPVVVRGDLQSLAVGQRVEVKGVLLNNLLNATQIEIEKAESVTATSPGTRTLDDNDVTTPNNTATVKVEGVIAAVGTDGSFTLQSDNEHASVSGSTSAQVLTVTLSPTLLANQQNSPAILAAGQRIEATGTLNGNIFVATTIVADVPDTTPTTAVATTNATSMRDVR